MIIHENKAWWVFLKECLPSFGKENGCVPINHYCYEEGDVWSDQRPVAVLWHRLAGNGPFQVSSESQEYYFTEIFTTSYLQFYNMHEYATHLKKLRTLEKNQCVKFGTKSTLFRKKSQSASIFSILMQLE